jgi:SH3-like domain-containing protein
MRITLLRMMVAAGVLSAACPDPAQADPAARSVSGLPLPRFVSLKADRVNVRAGPTKDHNVAWVFSRAGLPVEITAEFETWRRIRDWEGAEGWVYHSLLSGRRTVTVAPQEKNKDELLPLHESPSADAPVVAKLQVGVQASVRRCTGTWCRIAGERFDGWIGQVRLWGVYPNEKVE